MGGAGAACVIRCARRELFGARHAGCRAGAEFPVPAQGRGAAAPAARGRGRRRPAPARSATRGGLPQRRRTRGYPTRRRPRASDLQPARSHRLNRRGSLPAGGETNAPASAQRLWTHLARGHRQWRRAKTDPPRRCSDSCRAFGLSVRPLACSPVGVDQWTVPGSAAAGGRRRQGVKQHERGAVGRDVEHRRRAVLVARRQRADNRTARHSSLFPVTDAASNVDV